MTPEPARPAPSTRRSWWILEAVVVLGLTLLVVLLPDRPSEPPAARPPSPTDAGTRDPALSPRPLRPSGPTASPLRPPARPADLDVLSGDDPAAVRAAATRLRRAARTDPAALAALRAALLDPTTPPDLRVRVAIVLGTLDLPEVDRWLLETAERFAGEPGVLEAVVLAMGLARTPPDDDEVFDLAEQPHGVAGPGGLGVTVRRRIEDADLRAALLRFARHERADVRYAAARALSESVGFPDARGALTDALAAESEDRVAARLSEPLGRWAATAALGPERDAVLAGLLDRALASGSDETRFRLEKDLARSDLSRDLLDRLAAGADPSRPPEVRAFAMTVLPGAALRSGSDAVQRVRGLLEDALGRDAQEDVRDLAARQLGVLPPTAGTVAALSRAAREDREWRVRFAALGSLARHASHPAALAALRAAASDPDARVAAEARRLLPP